LLPDDVARRVIEPVRLRRDTDDGDEQPEQDGEERLSGMAVTRAFEHVRRQDERRHPVPGAQQPARSRVEGQETAIGEDDDGVQVRHARQDVAKVVQQPPIADDVVAHRGVALVIEGHRGADHPDGQQPRRAVVGSADDQQ
jgi:hypothetical protein